MSSARDEILVALAHASPAPETAPARPGRQALIPPRFVRETRDLQSLFLSKLTGVSASHAVLTQLADVPAHLADWLAARGLGRQLVLAREPALQSLPWHANGVDAVPRAPDILRPETIVTRALAGVAETGGLAFDTGGASRPVHNLLAQTHVVILARSEIVPAIEDAWRLAHRGGRAPRSIALITGPSRTADIEMKVELGVHGAVGLHVVIVENLTGNP